MTSYFVISLVRFIKACYSPHMSYLLVFYLAHYLARYIRIKYFV
jgi:hypothetical protein